MNIKRAVSVRGSTIKDRKYYLTAVICFSLVFNSALLTYSSVADLQLLLIAIGSVAISLAIYKSLLSRVFIASFNGFKLRPLLYSESLRLRLVDVLDRSLAPKTNVPLISLSLDDKSYYYPAANARVSPIISVSAFINKAILIYTVVHVVFFFIITGSFTGGIGVSIIAMLLSWICFVLINFYYIFKVKYYSYVEPTNYVDMQYTYKELIKMSQSQSITYTASGFKFNEQITPKKLQFTKNIGFCFIDNTMSNSGFSDVNYMECANLHNDLSMRLIGLSFDAAITMNDLINDYYADPNLLSNEIKTLEYILNTFIPKTAANTHRFFKKNSHMLGSARGIYKRDIAPKVSDEITLLLERVAMIHKSLRAISYSQKIVIRQNEERLIEADSALLALNSSHLPSIVYFPEFYQLHFDNQESKIAAINIMSGSLVKLFEAKSQSVSRQHNDKLEAHIERVKGFIKSLATGTPESEERATRLSNKSRIDMLHLDNKILDTDGIDNLIAIDERYISSYDYTLPLNK